MQELFLNISDKVKEDCAALMNIVKHTGTLSQAIKLIESYRSTLTKEEQDFMDFYFQLKMEELGVNGESNSN